MVLFAVWFYSVVALACAAVVFAFAVAFPTALDWTPGQRTVYSAAIGLSWPLALSLLLWGVYRS